MAKPENNLMWAMRMMLIASLGSWLLLLPIVMDYLEKGQILVSNNQDLVMLSFALALIGLISGIEISVDLPFKGIRGHSGATKLITVCMFSSALLVLGLCMFVLTPYFFVSA